MPEVHVISHPLVQHKLTIMRKKQTSVAKFRTLLEEISMLMGYELTRDMPLSKERIETPLMPMDAPVLEGKKVVVISILRAGDGILNGIMKLLPSARIGHIGLYRDPKTLEPVEYYFKVPADMSDRDAIVVDPMLATGNSATASVERIKATSPRSVKFCCLLAAPEGIAAFHATHPDVPIYTAAIDERLNDHGYILPGLGDAGDRMFGTK
ncbi:MAG: uracil phosphoribosyltransferase [Myxococcales bacterium]|nr:uracil phosphoribosyltransferase [Myxococcales bacterium]